VFEKSPDITYDVHRIKDAKLEDFKIHLPNIMLDDKSVVNLREILPNEIVHRIQEVLLLTYRDGKSYKSEALFRKFLTEKSLFDKILKRNVDKEHITPPPFITIWGPSLKKCACGFTGKLSEMEKHFESIYGSIAANRTSTHSNIHRMVQLYFSKNDVYDKLRREDVIGILKEVYGDHAHGNIWIPYMMKLIVQVATSFVETWKRTSEWEKELFLETFTDVDSPQFQTTMSREYRLGKENDLNVYLNDSVYTLPDCDITLAAPIDEVEYAEIKGNVPLPPLFNAFN
jgi:hypothetical protein